MIDGTIYVISSPMTQKVYVGSTTRDILHRLKEHRTKLTTPFQRAMAELGRKTFTIQALHSGPFESREAMTRMEGTYVKTFPHVFNVRIEGRTNREWLDDNKEHRKQYLHKYRVDHKNLGVVGDAEAECEIQPLEAHELIVSV